MSHQYILAIVLVAVLGIASSFPIQTCDKLKDVKEGADNYDQYLVKLKDPDNYQDAEYAINIVNQHQATLDQHSSNVHEPSVRSQLELSEKAGVLHGTLSQQALFLVCLESRVEFIMPNYPINGIDPQGSGEAEDVFTADCSKLVLKEPYHGNNYSIIFKPKTSLNALFDVITKMEHAKLDDSTLTFNYRYSIKKGKKISMVVEMNIKALQMVCEEHEVKQIEPNYDLSITSASKRSTESASEHLVTFAMLNGH